ncbi:hypothetical protein ABZ942_20095 [Nocardia sp. NPDC046473]|uniref:hypothetical protein n=1 Tax=Nocardia sp. NPDC046473 TaxID=3155733 RepID=UPI0033C7F730
MIGPDPSDQVRSGDIRAIFTRVALLSGLATLSENKLDVPANFWSRLWPNTLFSHPLRIGAVDSMRGIRGAADKSDDVSSIATLERPLVIAWQAVVISSGAALLRMLRQSASVVCKRNHVSGSEENWLHSC